MELHIKPPPPAKHYVKMLGGLACTHNVARGAIALQLCAFFLFTSWK